MEELSDMKYMFRGEKSNFTAYRKLEMLIESKRLKRAESTNQSESVYKIQIYRRMVNVLFFVFVPIP